MVCFEVYANQEFNNAFDKARLLSYDYINDYIMTIYVTSYDYKNDYIMTIYMRLAFTKYI